MRGWPSQPPRQQQQLLLVQAGGTCHATLACTIINSCCDGRVCLLTQVSCTAGEGKQ